MSSTLNFDGDNATVYAAEDDPIHLGLKLQSGHTGHNAFKLDVGAERQVCSNGMTAFVSDFHREQTHQEPLQPGLIESGVDAVVEDADKVEQRLQDAQERELKNPYEALLVMTDFGLNHYVDLDDLRESLAEEIDADSLYSNEPVSLYETYNAATRALTHHANDEVPETRLDEGFEQAAGILEYGDGIPHPGILGENAVERRVHEYTEDENVDEYWDTLLHVQNQFSRRRSRT